MLNMTGPKTDQDYQVTALTAEHKDKVEKRASRNLS